MKKIELIITADYEVFGDGTGAIDTCLIQPSENLMRIAEKHGASICFFVDVCEYWAFKEENVQSSSNSIPHYLKIENQLKDAIKRGHDVQLHFHPQWLDYSYDNGKWKLNMEYWRLANVEKLNGWTIHKLFEKGKQTLEEIIQPVKSNYKCDVFRAGAWSIQPEEKALQAMKELGFRIDSTVVPDKVFNNGRTFYDFSGTPNLPKWQINNLVTKEDEHGALEEFPIFSTKISGFRNFQFNAIQVLRKIQIYPNGCDFPAGPLRKKSMTSKILGVIKPQVKMLNCTDGISFEEMKYITKNAISKNKNEQKSIPIVAIGHPKTFANDNEFDKYLEWVNSMNEISFGCY
jgi:hypothetical protein